MEVVAGGADKYIVWKPSAIYFFRGGEDSSMD